MKTKNRQELKDGFLENSPRIQEEPAEEVAQIDESTFKDSCCQKAAGELEMLLEDIVEMYSNRKSEKLHPFKAALKQVRDMETVDCFIVKKYLSDIAKRRKNSPEGMKVNPLVQKARDILDDLERCEGIKKGWFTTLKTSR